MQTKNADLQMMVLFSSGLRRTSEEAKLQALEGWVQLLVALATYAPSHLKTVANQVQWILSTATALVTTNLVPRSR